VAAKTHDELYKDRPNTTKLIEEASLGAEECANQLYSGWCWEFMARRWGKH
jgi:hypothetical protein